MPVSCRVATLAAMHAALLRRSVPGLGAALLVAVVAGCGDPVPQGDAPPGTAVRVSGVSYDVQTARDLDPASPGDRSFFADAPRAGRGLPADQVWLGVFLQAQNDSGSTRRTASAMTLADTRGHVYRSVALGPGNDYAYRPQTLGPGDTEPDPESPASSSPEQGSLVLFHIPLVAFLHGRPLELRVGPGGIRLAF
jgi:hypothetical protein